MNPRQRRGVIILVLAVVAGVATFVAVFRYVALVNSQVGPMAQAVVVTRQVDAWTPLEADALTLAQVPRRWLPRGAVRRVDDVVGLVAPTTLPVGSMVQDGMVESPPPLPDGERTFAITVDREAGVAGQLEPESVVDVVAAYAATDDSPAQARAIVVDARVLSVDGLGTGRPQPAPQESRSATGPPESQTVTLALTPREGLDVSFAQSFSERVRLVKVPDGTRSELAVGDRVTVAPGGPAPPAPPQPSPSPSSTPPPSAPAPSPSPSSATPDPAEEDQP